MRARLLAALLTATLLASVALLVTACAHEPAREVLVPSSEPTGRLARPWAFVDVAVVGSGAPLAGATVSFWLDTGARFRGVLVETGPETLLTNERGHASAFVVARRVELVVEKTGFVTQKRTVSLAEREVSVDFGLVPENLPEDH